MEQNNIFKNRYLLEKLLGRGNFSEVWLAKDTETNINVALKIYAPATGLDDAGLNVFAREFSLVVNANHRNLLKPLYYDTFERKPFLVLPFCKKGSIMREVGNMSEKDAWRLLRDVASGLAWLHNMNPPVIHQDIKPDNVLIGDNGDFMITDFGVSTHVKSTLRKSMSAAFSSAGTIAYMAPERFSKDNTPIMANDIYSLGATVYEMLTGDTPFGNDGGLIQMKGADVPELKGNFSPQMKSVIARCLSTNPWERPTAEQLEKYADDGLNGRKISFVDDKTIWDKYKMYIIAAVSALIIAVMVFLILGKEQNDTIPTELTTEQIAIYNDSIEALVSANISRGDSLAEIGRKNDAYFEDALIDAFNEYEMALSQKLYDGKDTKNNEIVKTKLDSLTQLLDKAYEVFKEKTKALQGDKESVDELKDRMNKIKEIIDVTKYENEINNENSKTINE